MKIQLGSVIIVKEYSILCRLTILIKTLYCIMVILNSNFFCLLWRHNCRFNPLNHKMRSWDRAKWNQHPQKPLNVDLGRFLPRYTCHTKIPRCRLLWRHNCRFNPLNHKIRSQDHGKRNQHPQKTLKCRSWSGSTEIKRYTKIPRSRSLWRHNDPFVTTFLSDGTRIRYLQGLSFPKIYAFKNP